MDRPLRLLAVLALSVALASATAVAVAAQPTPPTNNQNNRPPRNPLVEEAQRSREAVELFRSMERNFVSDREIIGDVAAPTRARPVPARPLPAVPQPGVGVVASLPGLGPGRLL